MQQTYYCPNCRAPVAYGQPQCANCQTVLNWQGSQTQGQYQSSDPQYAQQQQQWNQAAADNRSAGSEFQGRSQPPDGDEGPGLLQWIKNNRSMVTKISIIVLVVAALIVTGIALQGEISKWFAAPVITAFDAGSSTIISGQEVTLQWDVSGASSVSISPGIGTVSFSGTRKMSPDETTTFTLTAGSRFGGSVSKAVTVTVTGKPPTVNSFKASPGGIYVGQTATLSWSVTGATSVAIQPEVGTVSPSGSKIVSPGSTTRYVLTASNSEGNSTASATLNVSTSNAPIITTFSASPTSINAGDDATLIWDVIGAKSININQGIGGVASKGSAIVKPAGTAIYTLRADSDYGSVTESVTVTVDTSNTGTGPAITKDPPEIKTFSASQKSIMLGDEITLTWAVDAARTVSISPSVGGVPSSGWKTIIPTATTTYKLSAINTFGTETAEVTVTVSVSTDGAAPLIRSFTASPISITQGETSSLTWDIKGATKLIIDQGIGILTSKYGQTVSPGETTDYTLTAINSYGTDNATVTVTVTVTP